MILLTDPKTWNILANGPATAAKDGGGGTEPEDADPTVGVPVDVANLCLWLECTLSPGGPYTPATSARDEGGSNEAECTDTTVDMVGVGVDSAICLRLWLEEGPSPP